MSHNQWQMTDQAVPAFPFVLLEAPESEGRREGERAPWSPNATQMRSTQGPERGTRGTGERTDPDAADPSPGFACGHSRHSHCPLQKFSYPCLDQENVHTQQPVSAPQPSGLAPRCCPSSPGFVSAIAMLCWKLLFPEKGEEEGERAREGDTKCYELREEPNAQGAGAGGGRGLGSIQLRS